MAIRRRRRALVELDALGLLPPPDETPGGDEEADDMYALDRNAPVPERRQPEPDGDRLERIEYMVRRIANAVAAMEAQIDGMDQRITRLERERDLLKARAGGIIWGVSFVIGTVVLGGFALFNTIREALRG